MDKSIIHTPVMAQEVWSFLRDTDVIVIDGTLGHGGHCVRLIEHGLHTGRRLIGYDRDAHMLVKARMRLGNHVEIVNQSYDSIGCYLQQHQLSADFVLLDLGVNMEHYKNHERGFSVRGDYPLDMRFDTKQGQTAAQFLQQANRQQIIDILQLYADMNSRGAELVSDALVSYRHHNPFVTTGDLKKALSTLSLSDKFLSLVFQAVRIAVNDEFGHLYRFLDALDSVLQPGGRCAILTYHSIEDRIVKYAFKGFEQAGLGTVLTKKTIKPTYQEKMSNKASKSAQLRVYQKG